MTPAERISSVREALNDPAIRDQIIAIVIQACIDGQGTPDRLPTGLHARIAQAAVEAAREAFARGVLRCLR